MRTIEIPALRGGVGIGITLEKTEIASRPAWVVSTRESVLRGPRRRWYPDEAAATAFAAQEAQRFALLLFDLREPGDAG